MARPRKDDDARLTETIAFRVTPAERLQLEADALAAGLNSAPEYARRKALRRGPVIVRQHRTLDHAVFDELRRIGNNLNQLARIANQTGRIPSRLEGVCAVLEQILVRELDAHAPARTASDGSARSKEAESAAQNAPPPPSPRGP
jgi:hypothetical protein